VQYLQTAKSQGGGRVQKQKKNKKKGPVEYEELAARAAQKSGVTSERKVRLTG